MQTTSSTNSSVWAAHHPITNFIWLHFLLYQLQLQCVEEPTSASDDVIRERELESKVQKRLSELEVLLSLETITKRWKPGLSASAAGLVSLAQEEGWLDDADVLGCDESSSLENSP